MSEEYGSWSNRWNLYIFTFVSVSVHKARNFLVYALFPWISIIRKRFVVSLQMILKHLLAFDMNPHPIPPRNLCLWYFFSGGGTFLSVACVWRWNRLSWSAKIIPNMNYHLLKRRHNLPQTFAGRHLKFSHIKSEN